jgi:hypothetical protein
MAATAVAAALVGAGGSPNSSNREGAKRAAQILIDAKAATASASSVRVQGQMTSSGALTTLDLVDGHGRGGGTLGESGASIHFVLAASKVYIRANASSWKTLLSNSAEANLA